MEMRRSTSCTQGEFAGRSSQPPVGSEPDASQALKASRSRVRPRPSRSHRRPRPGLSGDHLWKAAVLAVVGMSMSVQQPLARAGAPPDCDSGTQVEVVNSAESLAEFIGRTNCSHGVFNVTWQDGHTLGKPIVVGNYTELTISGAGSGAVLDGGQVTRIIEAAQGSTVVLNNLVLKNGSAPRFGGGGGGGGIFSDGADFTLNATSCAFEDNYSPFDGGAVFANGGSSTVTLVDSRFERNIAEYSGGAVLVDSASFLYALETIFVENSARDSSYGGGGAISCLGGSPQVSLHGCEFEGNNASMRGGAVYVDAQGGDLLLSSTRFERNWGRYGGGAVCASRTGTVEVIETTFEDNLVSDKTSWTTFGYYAGGGLYVYGAEGVTVRSSTFMANGAEVGGGIAVRGNSTVAVGNSSFEGNLAFDSGAGMVVMTYGGEPGTLQATFTNTTFAGNRCGGWGGGLYAFTNHIGTVTLADVKFSNNSALYVVYGNPGSYVGGAFFGSGRGLSTEAEDCVFESNVAGWGGGAVFIESGSFNATRTIFRGNLAHWHDGGAIVASVDDSSSDEPPPARIVLWDVQMESNWAAREGGGIAAKDRSEVRIQGSLLKDNTARSGGALSVSGGAVVLSEDSNFTKNSAAVIAGAVVVWGNSSYFEATSCNFSANAAHATDSAWSSSTPHTKDDAGPAGGAISAIDGGGVLLESCVVMNNIAEGRGGGVYCNGADTNVTIIDVEFEHSTSGWSGVQLGNGGAGSAVNGCSFEVHHSSFVGNRASNGGALCADAGAYLNISGCTFEGNSATNGGAIAGTGRNTTMKMVSCEARNNEATKEGGALRVYDVGQFDVYSSCLEGNSAGELGGAVHCYQSVMTISKCDIENNRVKGDGGALRVSYTSMVTVDYSKFIGNHAIYDGGAIAVDKAQGAAYGAYPAVSPPHNGTQQEDSKNLICRNTLFSSNTAGERGGALFATRDSSVELISCNSTSNRASLAGSMYLSTSLCVLIDCIFHGDEVPTGATVYMVAGNLRAKLTTFRNDEGSSGILAVQGTASSGFEALFCSFEGWAGSDVVLTDSGVVQLDSCDFSESTASTLVNVKEVNKARVRNARLSTGNYRAISSDSVGNSSLFGVNIEGCGGSECDDWCEDGDLGVYCGCYQSSSAFSTKVCLDDEGEQGDLVLTTNMSEITTAYPDTPKMHLEVTTSGSDKPAPVVWHLEWMNDALGLEWTALPRIGLVYPGFPMKIVVEADAAQNGDGEVGTTFTAEAPSQPDVVSATVLVNVSFVYCLEGFFWNDTSESCKRCAEAELNPEGLLCDQEGILLQTLPLAPGYWRASATSTYIRKCFNEHACEGNIGDVEQRFTIADDYCKEGYMGPYCSICKDGYTAGVSNVCHKCDSRFWTAKVSMVALVGVVFVALICIVVADLLANPALTDLNEARSAVSRWLLIIPFHKLKILFVVLQIITQYASITAIEFPDIFHTFLSTLDVINLDVGWLMTAICVVKVDFYGRLLTATIGPFVILLVLGGIYVYTCKKHRLWPLSRGVTDPSMYPNLGHRATAGSSESDHEPSVLRRVQDKYVTVALTVAFLLYSTISTLIFQTFSCDYLVEVGERYLRADYRIKCDSREHQAYEIYAALMILVYPIGIPMVFLAMLLRKRHLLNPPEGFPDGDASLNPLLGGTLAQPKEPDPRLLDRRLSQTAFLWRAYRPQVYYYEVVECGRRMLLTGCLVFIMPSSSGQAAVACLLSVLTIATYAILRPYHDPNDHGAYTLGALVIFLTFFMGLVVKVELPDEGTHNQQVLAVLLIVLTLGLLVAAVAECLLEARRLSRRDDSGRDEGHVFLRRDPKSKDFLSDEKEKYKTTRGLLHAPKLLDVPENRPWSSRNPSDVGSAELEKVQQYVVQTGTFGDGRQRGSAVFDASPDGKENLDPHVSIAGASSQQHASEVDTLSQPGLLGLLSTRGSGGGASGASGPSGASGHSEGRSKHFRTSSSSYSPTRHRRVSNRGERVQGEIGSFGLVPAEAESAPEGMGSLVAPGGALGAGVASDLRDDRDAGDGRETGNGTDAPNTKEPGEASALPDQRESRKSKKTSRSSRRSSVRRERRGSGTGVMRPAMPAAGPDEMRPSPGPDSAPPGPWRA